MMLEYSYSTPSMVKLTITVLHCYLAMCAGKTPSMPTHTFVQWCSQDLESENYQTFGKPTFQERPPQITTKNMFLLIEIRHNIHILLQ